MFRLVLRSLRYYWRAHLGVLLGTLLAGAVLTGALLVGDSVDGSLRAFAILRLGGVHFAAETRGQYVNDGLAPRLQRAAGTAAAAVLHLPGVALVQDPVSGGRTQVNQVQVLGVDSGFWEFGESSALELGEHQAAINTRLAAELGLSPGDEVALRVLKPSFIARDAPLSPRGDDRFQRARCTVKRVLTDAQLGRFSLRPSQIPPYNAFVNRAWLQSLAELPARANMLLADGGLTEAQLRGHVKNVWKPADIGLHFEAHPGGGVQLETDRVFFSPESARAARDIPGARGTFTYLVNSLAHGGKSTPYSFAVAGPVPDGMADDAIVINRWLSDQLDAHAGDRIEMAYSRLTASNQFVEHTREFTVHSVREMDELETERELMPEFPGLSDVERCADWDVGMPMDEERLRDPANEAYWEEYRQTPKAFVTLQAGQEMWANRFGGLTAVRYPGGAERIPELRKALARNMDPARAGLFFQPVREQARNAVNQAMDFGGLFLGLSFFLIAAAFILTGLLHVFGLQQRSAEMGALLALGFRHAQVRALFLAESLATALLGAAAGALLGSLYSRILIAGLARFWQGAVAGAAIQYHGSVQTLLLGGSATFLCAMLALILTLWRQSRHSARALLRMDFSQDWPRRGVRAPSRLLMVLAWLGLALAAAIVVYALLAKDANTSLAFFAAGAIALCALLGLFRHFLAARATQPAHERRHRLTLTQLALKNLARRPGRSLSVAGLLACGCFLVFAVASMQEDLHRHARQRDSGTGGFALFAHATIPLLENPAETLDDPAVSGTALKVRRGDDASCLNLNRPQAPQLLGVNVADMVSRNAFTGETASRSVWRLLELDLEDGAIPALVGDTNTAMWTLGKTADVEDGDTLTYRDEFGNDVKLKLVGKLPMRLSVFQGTVLISAEAFTRLFPSVEGYRMFLIDAPQDKTAEVEARLREEYERFGLEVMPAIERLEKFYAVESTYLAMFLVLGGLGLAVGSLGMGVVVLRNLLERRSELAILRALGFTARQVYTMLFFEYGVLLMAGLGIGAVAAAASVLPAFWTTQSHVAPGVQLGVLAAVLFTSAACTAAAVLAGATRDDPAALRNE